ncbi:MAG TPA: hydroxyisourate hydrolase [Chloroflexota bacterium]|nr:hydroxyisourate hydrolase [Chloroflexota bacterium]
MTTLSTHVLDTERGAPAAGVRVSLYADDRRVDTAQTGQDGRISDLGRNSLTSGTYRLVFDVGEYLTTQGRAAPFVQRVSLDFRVEADQGHYHVPLLITPFACTTYRGS